MPFPIETDVALPISLLALVERRVQAVKSEEAPIFLHMLGVPGVGKSTVAHLLEARLTLEAPSFVAFDKLMEAMPEYQAALADPEVAFAKTELQARSAGYLLLKRLIEKKASILFDHGGAFPAHPKLLHYAKEKGYALIVVEVLASPEVAKNRIIARAEETGRFTPLEYVDERLKVLEGLRSAYQAEADAFFEIPNRVPGTEGLIAACEEVVLCWQALSARKKADS